MTSRRINAFFYGLFMDADILRSKGALPEDIQPAAAPGFALRIGNRATLVADTSSVAHGILMRLRHHEIETLYAEPSVSMYKPEAIIVLTRDGAWHSAMVYNLVEPPAPEERNSEYAAKLRQLAVKLHLPPDYVDKIR
jgi:gamma-glutamyl AIG2-like cyclotransferase